MGDPAGLAKEQLRALARLKRVPELGGFYLAGGTAVAAHLGHRLSADIDLFSRTLDPELAAVSAAVSAAAPRVQVVAMTDAALKLRVLGVPVDIVRYPYPPLEPTTPGPEGFPVRSSFSSHSRSAASISASVA